jgi:hypothetical protein
MGHSVPWFEPCKTASHVKTKGHTCAPTLGHHVGAANIVGVNIPDANRFEALNIALNVQCLESNRMTATIQQPIELPP